MFLCTCLDYENSLTVENYYNISPSKGKKKERWVSEERYFSMAE